MAAGERRRAGVRAFDCGVGAWSMGKRRESPQSKRVVIGRGAEAAVVEFEFEDEEDEENEEEPTTGLGRGGRG
jgi:hypothetical protein